MDIAGITVYPYGLAVSAATLVCLGFAGVQIRRRQLRGETLDVFAAWGLPLTLFSSRLLYCLICIDGFSRNGIAYLFDFTGGGYTLWGAIGGGACAVLITAARTRQPVARIADALAAPSALLIALLRLSEGLVGQGYGWYIEDWFDPESGMSLFHPKNYEVLFRFPFAVQDMYGEWCWAVFVLEAILAVGICVLLLKQPRASEGRTALQALLLIATSQIFCESVRQDAVLRFGFVRVNQVIGAVVAVGILAYGCYRRSARPWRQILLSVGGTAICAGIIVAMEFALEKKIVFLEWMPMDLCYTVTATACAGMYGCVLSIFKEGVE